MILCLNWIPSWWCSRYRTNEADRMKNVGLYIFLYFTTAMALDVIYKSLDRIVWHIPPEWGLRILEENRFVHVKPLIGPPASCIKHGAI